MQENDLSSSIRRFATVGGMGCAHVLSSHGTLQVLGHDSAALAVLVTRIPASHIRSIVYSVCRDSQSQLSMSSPTTAPSFTCIFNMNRDRGSSSWHAALCTNDRRRRLEYVARYRREVNIVLDDEDGFII